MNTSNNNIQDFIRAKLESLKNWLFRYSKIVMPVILVICVVVTVVIAVNANKRKIEEEQKVEATEEVDMSNTTIDVPQVALEQDAVPEINELFDTYYNAMMEGDTDTMDKLVDHLDATEILKAQETSKYIESYPTMEVYTKKGPKEGTYIAYVYSEVKFYDYERPIPGMQAYYVCTNENGDYYLNEDGEENENVINYIRELSLQEDVIDLSNKAAVSYNDMLAEDERLADFILDLNSEIDKNVGEALARAEGSSTSSEEEETSEGEDTPETDTEQEEETSQDEPVTVVTKVKATDVVNIRTSDSETADKLGKAAVGDEFTLLEERGNGWSKIRYEGRDAFIKSEFLEPSETEQANAGESAQETETTTTQTTQTDNSDSGTVTGKVTVKDNVRIRASASESGEKLGTAYVGEQLDLIMKQADGWTKIKYNGKTAYVKSDYVE